MKGGKGPATNKDSPRSGVRQKGKGKNQKKNPKPPDRLDFDKNRAYFGPQPEPRELPEY